MFIILVNSILNKTIAAYKSEFENSAHCAIIMLSLKRSVIYD